ncbi:hypothetical protein CASFOL_040808 [Castilleja foliolosa]|uniref:RING-type E3 ubiquitin transferase n=1 Tax=Castilleja foliolosa TaxID=1961234 RepID=A0ABD3BCV7_9LAMI
MASAAIFSSMRRRRSPSLEAFLAPVNISNAAILQTLRAISTELVSSFSGDTKTMQFYQVKNSRSLVRKIQVISILLDAFPDVGFSKTSTSVFLCFKELYLLLYRSRILIDYVKGSSKLWLLLQNHSISGHFHDLNQEISTLFDVFPLGEINLPEEVKEQVELLSKQSRKSKLFIDKHDDLLRLKLYYFLNEFENGIVLDKNVLRPFFVEKLGIRNVESCRYEIEFLEEQIVNHDGDIEPTASILNGFVALMRYCRFLLFRFEDEVDLELNHNKKSRKGFGAQEIGETLLMIPKDFCCPVSLDLMKDPVIISTGQTYERSSISRWMQEGHCTCPKTGQMLIHTKLVPNRALRNLIMLWCTANEIPYDPPENSDYYSCSSNNNTNLGSPSKASIVATKATSLLLVGQLANGSPRAKTVAAMEIRFLAKTGKHNRACLAEAGAIPLLKGLLSSFDTYAQENSVTALLNLSIYDKNKSVIMEVDGCLAATVEVLRYGLSTEARENAAATLFSLSAVHEFKKRIAHEKYVIEALSGLLRDGSPRGQKDAVTALFNLSTHVDNCERLIESGAIKSLVEALRSENVSEEAAGALALIVRQPRGAEAVGNEETAVAGLIGVMRCGGPRGKENAVSTLLELCRSGGAAATERVVRSPALAGLVQGLLFTGTKRARRKAASLARVFQRLSESASLHFGGLGVGYALAGDSAVAMQVSISVPVL